MLKIIENPLRKEVHNSPYYSKLLSLDKEGFEKVEGEDADGLIRESSDTTAGPSDTVLSEELNKFKLKNKQMGDTLRLISLKAHRGDMIIERYIHNPEQARQVLSGLCGDTQERGRTYIEDDDKDKFKKYPVFGVEYENPKKRKDIHDTLDWIIETGKTEKYEELMKKGNRGEGYNGEHDYDSGSLLTLNHLVGIIKNPNKNNTPGNERNIY